jgi:hypothetical protein
MHARLERLDEQRAQHAAPTTSHPKMTQKLLWGVALGCGGSIILFWIPTFVLGWFDGHMSWFWLLCLFCPLLVCPFVAVASWILRPSIHGSGLATSLMLPSINALTWRSYHVHYVPVSQVVHEFLFLLGWLETEVLAIAIPLSFAVSAIRGRQATTSAAED